MLPVYVLSEGQPLGIDPIVLNAGFQELRQDPDLGLLAQAIDLQPVGSKTAHASMIVAYRNARKTSRVFALRDRDFLRLTHLQEARTKAWAEHDRGSWPLSFHAIESYLLEPDWLSSATDQDPASVAAALTELGSSRRWLDVERAAREDLLYRLRQQLRDHEAERSTIPLSLEATVQRVRGFLQACGGDVAKLEPEVPQVVSSFAEDFASNGPLWTRIDAKAALPGICQTLNLQPGLLKRLTRHATIDPPPMLVAELRTFLESMRQALLPTPIQ